MRYSNMGAMIAIPIDYGADVEIPRVPRSCYTEPTHDKPSRVMSKYDEQRLYDAEPKRLRKAVKR